MENSILRNNIYLKIVIYNLLSLYIKGEWQNGETQNIIKK